LDSAGNFIDIGVYEYGQTDSIPPDTFENPGSINSINISGVYEQQIKIVPNPAITYFEINNISNQSYIYQIITLEGKEILSGTIKNNHKKINTSTLKKGIYFIHLININSHQKFISKIIIH